MNATHLDIFSGIGGFAIAAQWAGFRTVGFCESDSRCREFLEKRWGLPVAPDIRKFDASIYSGINLLTGGPPCQPVSRAGKQGGAGDDRWLWPEALRVLDQAKPDCVVFENPLGIGDVGIDGILSEMAGIGYEVQPFDIPACAVDSPQLRHRYWIVGFRVMGLSDCDRPEERQCWAEAARHGHSVESATSLSVADSRCERSWQNESEREQSGRAADRRDCADKLADSNESRSERPDVREGRNDSNGLRPQRPQRPQSLMADTERQRRERRGAGTGEAEGWESFGSTPGLHWQNSIWVPCADGKLRRAPDDSFMLVDGLHRSLLGALGNAIVPQVAYEILKSAHSILTA